MRSFEIHATSSGAASAVRAFGNRALVAAGVAANAPLRDRLDQLGRGRRGAGFEDVGEGRHGFIVRQVAGSRFAVRGFVTD